MDQSDDDETSLITQIDTGFSGLIRSERLTLCNPSWLTTNVSVGQTTIILDVDILDNLNTDSFSGLIPSERIKGLGSLGTGSTTVSLSTSFVGAR